MFKAPVKIRTPQISDAIRRFQTDTGCPLSTPVITTPHPLLPSFFELQTQWPHTAFHVSLLVRLLTLMLGLPLASSFASLSALSLCSLKMCCTKSSIDWEGRHSCSPRVYGFLYASKFPLRSFLQQKDNQSIFLQLGYLYAFWTVGPSARQWRVMSPGPTSMASFSSITIFSGAPIGGK